jgi:hypothetical protein
MKILVVGDSYSFGYGCSDRLRYFDLESKIWVGNDFAWNGPSEFCWASLLQKQYPNLTIINKSVPGIDNVSILINLLNSCQITIFDAIIFSASYSTRKQIADLYDPENVVTWIPNYTQKKSSHTQASEEYLRAIDYYVKHLSNNAIDLNLTASAILAAFGRATTLNSKFLWSRPETDIQTKLLDSLTSYQINSIQTFDFSGVHDDWSNYHNMRSADKTHVNDVGHRIYFEKQIVPKLKELKIIS